MIDSFWGGNIESVAFIGGYLQESPDEIYQRFNRAIALLGCAYREAGVAAGEAVGAFQKLGETFAAIEKLAGSTKNRNPSRRHYRKRYV